MGVKWTTKASKFPEMIKTMESLNGKSVEVGCITGNHQWLASIHEYGCTITPKKAQYLTVPVHPDAVGRKAGSFPDLFFIQGKSGERFLARDTGKNSFEVMYWLTKSVTIPERSFLRAGHDAEAPNVLNKTEKLVKQLLNGDLSEQQFLDTVGQTLSTKIKKYARDLSAPANSWATKEAKGSSNPLVDTGGMINGISWRVKGGK